MGREGGVLASRSMGVVGAFTGTSLLPSCPPSFRPQVVRRRAGEEDSASRRLAAREDE